MIENVIFDLDGTLLDTIGDIRQALNETLVSFGFSPITSAHAVASIGHGSDHLIKQSLGSAQLEGERLREFKSMYYERQLRYQLERTKPFQDIVAMLEELRRRGIRAFVFTNKPHAIAVKLIDVKFGNLILETVGQQDAFPPKPDITALRNLATKRGIIPEKTFFVGDSLVDIATGRAAGMPTVAVTWGYVAANTLLNERPDYLIETPRQLLDIAARVGA